MANATGYIVQADGIGYVTAGPQAETFVDIYVNMGFGGMGPNKLTVSTVSDCGTTGVPKSLTLKFGTNCPAFRSARTMAASSTNNSMPMDVSIYPNPSKGNPTLTISSWNKTADVLTEVRNELGAVVYTQKDPNKMGNTSIKLKADLANGIYTVTCTVGTEKQTKKLIITR